MTDPTFLVAFLLVIFIPAFAIATLLTMAIVAITTHHAKHRGIPVEKRTN